MKALLLSPNGVGVVDIPSPIPALRVPRQPTGVTIKELTAPAVYRNYILTNTTLQMPTYEEQL